MASTAKETATGPLARPAARAAARSWTVRELADEFAVTTRTLRFYEAEGLLAPERNGTARSYSARDHARLQLILRGRRFGMSLGEIADIVSMYDGAESSEKLQLSTLLTRLDEIASDLRDRQRDLRRTLTEIDDVARRCRARLDDLAATPPRVARS